jgi:hypothetical protein
MRLKKFTRFVEPGTLLVLCAIITGFLFWRFSHWYYDDPFITFRYTQNLLAGRGLVYNPGERVLSTTTPFFAVLLAILGFFSANLPRLADAAGIVCLAASGTLLWRLGRQWQLPLAGLAGFLLLPLFPLGVGTLGSEMPLYLALALGALWVYSRGAYVWTALLCACLAFVRPDGVLLPAVLTVHFLWRVRGKIPWKALFLYAAFSALGWGLLWVYFGSPLPATLAAKQGQGAMANSQHFAPGLFIIASSYAKYAYFWVELGLAGLGLAWLLVRRSPALILAGWTAVYFAAYSVLGVTRYTWYYAPLLPAFLFLAGAGLQAIYDLAVRVKGRFSHPTRYAGWILGAVLVALFIFEGLHLYRLSLSPDPRFAIYQQAGDWLDANTPPDSKVGTLEVGIMGYYAHRTMIDFAGLIQPSIFKQMKPGSTYEEIALYAVQAYHPDYLVLQAGIFPALESGYVRNQCQAKARFSAGQYQAPWDLVIYHCSP